MENGEPKTVNGLLLVDKPEGWTSHDVVAKVRSILREELRSKNNELRESPNSKFIIHKPPSPKVKVGHTGTLDPFATGLLVLVLGNYTKRAGEFSKLDKIYEAELILGKTSTTGDKEGEITESSKQEVASREVEEILRRFIGKIQQTPHRFSAVKVGGKRAYKIARAGEEVKIEPREVTIYELTDVKYDYPKLEFTAKVSSGTYIRSLAEDIGEALGTSAYLSALRRTHVGQYKLEDAQKIDQLTLAKIAKV